MLRSMFARCVPWLALAAAMALTGQALAQDGLMSDPEPLPEAAPTSDPVAADANVPGTLVADPKPAASLEQRIADLEAAAKKAAAKEAADKEKAAGAPTVKVGGRVFVDSLMFNQDPASAAEFGQAKNTTYFRLARLHVMGDMFDVFSYRMEMDFIGRDTQDPTAHQFTQFKDVYAQMRELPVLGTVTIGHFKEPFSLEELTSDSFTTFMERSLPNVFWPARNIGVGFLRTNEEETMTVGAGVFAEVANEPPFFQDDNSGTAMTARATWLPWYDEASDAGLLHLGLGYSYRVLDAFPTQTIRQRPEVAQGPYMTAASFTDADHNNRIGPELAFMYGSFSLQSEWTGSWIARGDGEPDAYVNGYYIFASYFLTGEHRNYKRSEARWDRVKPLANFFRVRTADGNVETGKGAWEVAYRYSYLNLTDPSAAAVSGIDPAVLTDHTLGLNWYLTPYSRLMFNYVHANRTITGTTALPTDVFEMRCQIDF